MPIASEEVPHRKGKRRWWMVPLLPPVVLVGLFVASLFMTLHLELGNHHLKAQLVQVKDTEIGSGFEAKKNSCAGLFQMGDWVYFAIAWRSPHSVQQLRRWAQEAIPLGSSPTQVQQRLKSRGIEYYHSEELGYDSRITDRGHKREQLGGITTGTVSETNFEFFMYADTELVFLYDRNSKLMDYFVEERWTGP